MSYVIGAGRSFFALFDFEHIPTEANSSKSGNHRNQGAVMIDMAPKPGLSLHL
jgi:hypothetical protein